MENVFHVSEKTIVERAWTVLIGQRENRFVFTENAMHSRKKSKLERYVISSDLEKWPNMT